MHHPVRYLLVLLMMMMRIVVMAVILYVVLLMLVRILQLTCVLAGDDGFIGIHGQEKYRDLLLFGCELSSFCG